MRRLTITNPSNYLAQIVELNDPIPHPNADKLEGFVINNQIVWYAKELLKKGNIVIYFPIECQIDGAILSKLNLFADKSLNADNTKAGYFDHKGRVRAVKLRGEPSEGFIISLLDFQNVTAFEEPIIIGTKFDTIDNRWVICKKYVPAPSKNSGTGAKEKIKKDDILVDGQFAFHYNTSKIVDQVYTFASDNIITITKKLHGTSAVFGNLLTKRKLDILERIAKFFGAKVNTTEYKRMYSSRSVLKSIEDKYHTESQGYSNTDVWGKCFQAIKEHIDPGITLYGEIVGYQDHSKIIQKGYDYGEQPGNHRFYVYRITHTSPENNVIEFSWDQVKHYCLLHGLDYVPEYYHGSVGQYLGFNKEQYSFDFEHAYFIKQLKEEFLEKVCTMCKNKVPDEGIVIRNESNNGRAYKLKSFMFLERESKQLDDEQNDIETEEG